MDISYADTGGILQDQGLNPGLLHWQADSLPMSHQESPLFVSFALLIYGNAVRAYITDLKLDLFF